MKLKSVNQNQYNDNKWAKRKNLGKSKTSDKVMAYDEGYKKQGSGKVFKI